MKTQILFVLLLFNLLFSCSKKNDTTPNATPQDYRNQYLGDYYCSGKQSTSYRGDSNNYTTYITTIIHVYKSEVDSSLLISGTGLKQDSAVVIFFPDQSFRNYVYYHEITSGGNFILDSIFFYQVQSSLGMSSIMELKGKKQ